MSKADIDQQEADILRINPQTLVGDVRRMLTEANDPSLKITMTGPTAYAITAGTEKGRQNLRRIFNEQTKEPDQFFPQKHDGKNL